MHKHIVKSIQDIASSINSFLKKSELLIDEVIKMTKNMNEAYETDEFSYEEDVNTEGETLNYPKSNLIDEDYFNDLSGIGLTEDDLKEKKDEEI